MKLIRAVLRHSLLIAIVVGAGLAYYYRDELLPRFYEKVAEFRGTTEEASEPATTPAPEQAAEAEVVVTAADTAAAPEPPPPAGAPSMAGGAEVGLPSPSPVPWAPTPRATPAIEQAPGAAVRPPMNLSAYRPLEDEPEDEKLEVPPVPVTTAPATTPTPTSTPTSTPMPVPQLRGEAAAASQATVTAPAGRAETAAPRTPPEATLPEAQVPAQAESEPAAGTVPPPSVTEPPAPPDTARRDKLRIDARSAFWRHDYQQAEKDYQALIQLDPDDPDAYGELGNVYFSQGNWKAAGGAFYEAALRLIESGQVGRARHLLTVIQGLDPERAGELEQQLATAQGGAGN